MPRGVLKTRRKVIAIGTSHALTIPSQLERGSEVTLAADRVMLVDPQGEIAEDDLMGLLQLIEEDLYEMLRKRGYLPARRRRRKRG